MRYQLAVLLVLLLPTGLLAQADDSQPPILPIPEDLQASVDESSRLGSLLYAADQAAWKATDALEAHLGSLEDKHLGGFLAVEEDDEWSVLFVNDASPQRVIFRVTRTDADRPHVEPIEPPRPLSPTESSLFRATATAMAAATPIEQTLNPVVLPPRLSGHPEIFVYLLASTTRPDIAVLGRHFRAKVSASTGDLVEIEPLTKGILELSRKLEGRTEKVAGLVVSHIVTDFPLETHVFASLTYDLPVAVGTQRGAWYVSGRTILLLNLECEKAPVEKGSAGSNPESSPASRP